MKKIIFILFITLCVIACSKGEELRNQEAFNNYEIITIDSCEYIMWGSSYGFLNVTHKGNCKYCILRTKEQR